MIPVTKILLVFAINYATARDHVRQEYGDTSRWLFIDEPQRLYGLEPSAVQVVKLGRWWRNAGTGRALGFWQERCASRKVS